MSGDLHMRARLFLFVLLIPLAGCAYVCHDYPRFEQNFPQDAWRIKGKIERFHAEGYRSGPGSWPHWPSKKDDRYRITLIPIARDTTIWTHGSVHILRPEIAWAGEKRNLEWSEIQDLQKDAKKWNGAPRFHSLANGKYRFTSEFFPIGTAAVPDTLWFHGILQVESQKPIRLDIPCPIDLHVRWGIIDAATS